MSSFIIPALPGIIIALITTIPLLINTRSTRRKLDSESSDATANAAKTIVLASSDLIEQMKMDNQNQVSSMSDQIDYLRYKLDNIKIDYEKKVSELTITVSQLQLQTEELTSSLAEAKDDINNLQFGIIQLQTQIKELGHIPIWPPITPPPATPSIE